MGSRWREVSCVNPDKRPYTFGQGRWWPWTFLYVAGSKIIAVNIVYLCLFCSNVPACSATQNSKQQISVLNVQTIPIIVLIQCTYNLVLQILCKSDGQKVINYTNFKCFLLQTKKRKTAEPFHLSPKTYSSTSYSSETVWLRRHNNVMSWRPAALLRCSAGVMSPCPTPISRDLQLCNGRNVKAC